MSFTETPESLFEDGIRRYQAGEPPADLVPLFQSICERQPRSSASWTCLSWLYLLLDEPRQAMKAAQRAVKLNPQDPQARVNLALAMLETDTKGVRQHIDIALRVITVSAELRQDLRESLADGQKRKLNWASLDRVQNWLFPI